METQEVASSSSALIQTQSNQNDMSLKYTHVLCRGVTEIEHYGLKLAKKSSCLPSVVTRAHEIAKNIMRSRQKNPIVNDTEVPSRSLRYLLASQLVLACQFIASHSPTLTKNYLKELQTQFTFMHGQHSISKNKNNHKESNPPPPGVDNFEEEM